MSALHCILCGDVNPPGRVETPKFRDGGEARHTIATCGICGHVQIHPLMSLEEERRYYSNDSQPRDIFKDSDYVTILRAKSRADSQRRLAWLRSFVPPDQSARVLDIGCGYGFFVHECADYEAHGLDASTIRVDIARQGHGQFHQGIIDEAFVTRFEGHFDAVTAFHHLEILRDPVRDARALSRLIKPGGVLLLEVPNIADELMEIPEYAIHHWQVGHYSHFDKPRFELLLMRAGFIRFKVAGVQRYDLRHLLQWTDQRKPDLTTGRILGRNALCDRMERLYREDREERLTCDTLIATVWL